MSDALTWFKSTYSGSQGDCVEVAKASNGLAVRDSKNREGTILRFSASTWRGFTDTVKR